MIKHKNGNIIVNVKNSEEAINRFKELSINVSLNEMVLLNNDTPNVKLDLLTLNKKVCQKLKV
jgi:post-segregation antitoxin (ccd killing protein)